MKIGSDRTVLIGAPMKTSAGVASTAIARLRPIKRRRSPISARRLSPADVETSVVVLTTWLRAQQHGFPWGLALTKFNLAQLPRQVSLKNANLQCGKRVFLNA
jgi:hypothetical protein